MVFSCNIIEATVDLAISTGVVNVGQQMDGVHVLFDNLILKNRLLALNN